MNHPSTLRALAHPCALTLALAVVAHTAMAAGQHAGGHGDSVIGEPGKAASVTRTVRIDMSDAMRYTPANIDARQGETVRFVITNSGKVKHELVLGTEKELKAHYEVMKKFPEMEHDDPNMVTVAPGQIGEVIWKFTRAGKVNFACLQPGHYDAGMKGAVAVEASKAVGKAPDLAKQKAEDHGAHHPAATASTADMAEGEIRKVDKDAKKITIRHGEIRSLDMPPMTMVFQVRDVAMLDTLKAGDKVRFAVEKSTSGLVVTDIRPAP